VNKHGDLTINGTHGKQMHFESKRTDSRLERMCIGFCLSQRAESPGMRSLVLDN
jgi:hypothetical protein